MVETLLNLQPKIACSARELRDRVNNPVMPPEMTLTNIAMPMPMFASRLTSQQYHERKSPALARSFTQKHFGKPVTPGCRAIIRD